MAHIDLDGDEVVVTLTLAQRLGALSPGLRAPRQAVTAVDDVDDPLHSTQGVRWPGLHLPRRRKLGTWRRRGRRELVDARAGQPGLRLHLDGAHDDSVLVSVDPGERDRVRDLLGR